MRTIAWYINPERIAQFIGTNEAIEIASKLRNAIGVEHTGSTNNLYRLKLKEKVEDYIEKNKVKSLYQLFLNDELKIGKLFTLYQRFFCKGLSGYSNLEDFPESYTATLHEKLSFNEKNDWKIIVNYSPRNLISYSAFNRLSGSSILALYAYITKIEDNTVYASPLIIGDPDEQSSGIYIDDVLFQNYGEVHPYSIASFERVNDFIKDGNELTDISIMKSITEEKIQAGFAKILGQDLVPIDWGGEKSDLFTSNIKIRTSYVTGAFMFKGPSKFHEMKPKDLGKNGDQIDRLFSEPAQICILQHCHKVATSVRSQMKAYANRFYDRRLFSIIDGYQTMNILVAYNLL